ncbi:MAG: hypothetical protein JEZ11_23265 [Desulfobacterales bacterium]|nr:hypothetical protein [Desulfobacterales bacterium]
MIFSFHQDGFIFRHNILLALAGYWILDTGYWILDTGYWMLDAGYWMLDTGYWMLDTGYWILDAGCWIFKAVRNHASDFTATNRENSPHSPRWPLPRRPF